MDVTEIRVKLTSERDEKLRAYCSVTFDDCFVVRDVKIIQGPHGMFVAMPSRKLTDICPDCRGRNHLRASFCCECGRPLDPDRAESDERGRSKLHADIAHPIHAQFRQYLEARILEAYEEELRRAGEGGSRPCKGGCRPPDPRTEVDGEAADDPEDSVPEAARPAPDADHPPHQFGEGIL